MLKKIFSFIVLVFVSFVINVSFASDVWKDSVLTNDLEFLAELKDDNRVYMSWKTFDSLGLTGDFEYYVIMRSTVNSNPVYPNDVYIKYDTDIDADYYVDSYPKEGVNYYRVCAITSQKDRYCSNVDSVTVSVEPTTVTSLSDELKQKVDDVLEWFYENIEDRYPMNDKRTEVLDGLISTLDSLRQKNASLRPMIDYMLRQMEKRKAIYQEWFSDFIVQ